MKNKKFLYISLLGIILFLGIIICKYNLFSGVGADDDFSRCVKFSLLSTFSYQGSSLSADGVMHYHFQFKRIDSESVSELVETLNRYDDYLDGPTEIHIWASTSSVSECVFCLYNYATPDSKVILYDGFYRFERTDSYSDGTLWENPELYSKIDKLCLITIPDLMQEKADEEGIDWYEIWPDLEEVIVYETDERGRRIE